MKYLFAIVIGHFGVTKRRTIRKVMGGGGGGGGGELKKIHARQNVRKKNYASKNPKKKIHAHDWPHFDIKLEL